MLFRTPIDQEPKDQPDKTNRARDNKGPAPAIRRSNPGDNQRSYDRANVRARIKYSGSQSPLFLGEPLGNGFDRCGEISCFPKPKHKARGPKTQSAMNQAMGHSGQTPE